MNLSTVSDWLKYINSLHATKMDFDLSRARIVGERLNVLKPKCKVITVAGTNGKGSTVTVLDAIYRTAGYQTALFTSPYLFCVNEQIQINGMKVNDLDLCNAFLQVELNRGEITLTIFEFMTLAAFYIFNSYCLDIWILEVGLGGRLDAVNLIDSDIAVITSIDLDHQNILGNTREEIAFEKAGILRKHQLAVYGEKNPPVSLMNEAKLKNVNLFCLERDYQFFENNDNWEWKYNNIFYQNLPCNGLYIQNMAIALMVVTLLQDYILVSVNAIKDGIKSACLFGRFQIIPGNPKHIFDVAHNPASIKLLANFLNKQSISGKIIGVFSMLADKNIVNSLNEIKNLIDEWHVAPLNVERGANQKQLQTAFEFNNIKHEHVSFYNSLSQAYQAAFKQSIKPDVILIFGSFYTVAQIFPIIETDNRQ